MNFTLKQDDKDWQGFLKRARAILKAPDSLLKKAFLVGWPQESKSHFDQEEGFDGPWAPWKESTRSSRIVHEIRSAIGKQHAPGRLSSAERERGDRKVAARQARDSARGKSYRRGGKLLQVTGRLRTETAMNPIMRYTRRGLLVESPTPYSGYLDEGTKHDDGTKLMEARPFMWLGEEAQDRLADVFSSFLLNNSIGGSA